MLNDMIFDRTAADVDNKTAKGFYRYTDLNRVRDAVVSVRTRLQNDGYSIKYFQVSAFDENVVPKANRMNNYINAVLAFRGKFAMPSTYNLPVTMDALDWRGANEIERFLYDLDLCADGIEDAWCYSDEIFSGEVDL